MENKRYSRLHAPNWEMNLEEELDKYYGLERKYLKESGWEVEDGR